MNLMVRLGEKDLIETHTILSVTYTLLCFSWRYIFVENRLSMIINTSFLYMHVTILGISQSFIKYSIHYRLSKVRTNIPHMEMTLWLMQLVFWPWRQHYAILVSPYSCCTVNKSVTFVTYNFRKIRKSGRHSDFPLH